MAGSLDQNISTESDKQKKKQEINPKESRKLKTLSKGNLFLKRGEEIGLVRMTNISVITLMIYLFSQMLHSFQEVTS